MAKKKTTEKKLKPLQQFEIVIRSEFNVKIRGGEKLLRKMFNEGKFNRKINKNSYIVGLWDEHGTNLED